MSRKAWIITLSIVGGLLLVCVVCGGVLALLLMPAMGKAKEAANRLRVMSQVREVDQAIITYSFDHNGDLPARLEDLRPYLRDYDTVTTNPMTHERPCFIYQPPAGVTKMTQIQDASRAIILYTLKDGGIDANGPVGFADGHVDPRPPATPPTTPPMP